MRIVALAHAYLPHHNAGAETMLASLLEALVEAGHDVHVSLSNPGGVEYTYNGVHVHPQAHKGQANEMAQEADVLITHLENTEIGTALAQIFNKPLVHVLHNTFGPSKRWLARGRPTLAVYNSQWMREDYGKHLADYDYTPRHLVIHPPVDVEKYTTTPGGLVTMVNLWPNKGCAQFWRLAKSMPDTGFLAVKGGYGDQEIEDLPNVEVMPNIPAHEMRDEVYSRTRVLLMPSEYESWGRTGVEAMCSGIPVIAHPTPGLRESLGDAGIFINRDDTDAWVRALTDLSDGRRYRKAARMARERALALTPDLTEWVTTVEGLPHAAARDRLRY